MAEEMKCTCGAAHHGHLCMLRSAGKLDEIARISTDPEFYCFTCGGEADCAENLCEPVKIE
ncbi:MAG: hypothetical protein IPQ16_08800 [Geobacteraceae bacterium]|nr:hypothetical protein [Geobacteraceae bacterium]